MEYYQPASAASLPVLLIHGGTGKVLPGPTPEEKARTYSAKLEEALYKGYEVLIAGGDSISAVEQSIRILEDSPLFNSGKGSVFTSEDVNELDASIMDGYTLRAGSVAGTRTIRNPVSAARAVMERSKHVMLTGAGADRFAAEQGLEIVDNSYFRVEERWQQHLQLKKEEEQSSEPSKYGTVGAVALDKSGRLAAGTSTGGMMNKKYGRVGDSPIISAGTYANRDAAVSCTGYGEFFIRAAAAHDICARKAYKSLSIDEAAREVIHGQLAEIGGRGGVIALDAGGAFSIRYSTEGMFWGYITAEGKPVVNVCHMIIS
jgi:L-asparaginase / beta-aspartyl-peptidase